jgi:hypothetical protein
MAQAHKMLTLEIASLPEQQKRSQQKKYIQNMVAGAKSWAITS